jgi:hypothetical protein
MKRGTLKHLGDRLREAMRLEDDKGSEEVRKLLRTWNAANVNSAAFA